MSFSSPAEKEYEQSTNPGSADGIQLAGGQVPDTDHQTSRWERDEASFTDKFFVNEFYARPFHDLDGLKQAKVNVISAHV